MINQALENDIRNLTNVLPKITFKKNVSGKYFSIDYEEHNPQAMNSILYKNEIDRNSDYESIIKLQSQTVN